MREVNEFMDTENQLGDKCYEEGNFEEAVKHWQTAYKLGSLEAGYHLANRYYYGEGVEQDLQKSLRLFLECANSDIDADFVVLSQFNAANSYFNGEGVEKNMKTAFEWYIKAADNGHPSSQFNVGLSYYKGMYLEQDLEKAFEYMKEAADNDVPLAQYVVGTMYLAGHGVQPNANYAKLYFKKSADNGNNNALQILEKMEEDERRARELEEMKSKFKGVVEVESPEDIKDVQYVSMDNIGDIYGDSDDEQEYEEINDDMDMEDIIALADSGNPHAQNIAGRYYMGEDNEDYDEKKAFAYFSRAAAKNHPEGTFNLGLCFINGDGVAEDLMMGLSRVVKAAELGCLKACQFMYDISLRSGEIDKAIEYLHMALKFGDINAAYELGCIYEDGEYVGGQDLEKALKYFEICAADGDEDCLEKVKQIKEKLNK